MTDNIHRLGPERLYKQGEYAGATLEEMLFADSFAVSMSLAAGTPEMLTARASHTNFLNWIMDNGLTLEQAYAQLLAWKGR